MKIFRNSAAVKGAAALCLSVLLAAVCAGCGASKAPEAPASGAETSSSAASSQQTADVEARLTESLLTSIAGDKTAGSAATPEQFEDAYIAYLTGAEEELTPADRVRGLYAEAVSVIAVTAENGTVEFTLKTPDLSAILQTAAASLSGAALTKEALLAAAAERLASGDYPAVESTVSAAYTEGEGLPVIEGSGEYTNALLGGLVELYNQQFEILSAAAKEGT